MYLEAKETAQLYKLLSEKLGNDTTEAMFKYIDNKTERSVEASIKTLATKDDLLILRKEMSAEFTTVRKDMSNEFANVRKELSTELSNMRKEISESKAENIKWMFVFWIGQVGATLAIIFLFLKK